MHIWFIAILLLISGSGIAQIKLTNNSDKSISKIETVKLSDIDCKNLSMKDALTVYNKKGESVLSQLIDENSDGLADQVAFSVEISPKSFGKFRFVISKKLGSDTIHNSTYCRFIPERMDDFAWENNKVAFRVYGPKCEELAKQKNPAGLISSGIDCWLKRVEYPIIDKWYKKGESGGSYHQDDGEGLDNFHVGMSRGCGGTAIRINGDFICSGNFSKWQVLTNGPLISIFKLRYEPVFVAGKPVIETKKITIERGDNFYRCDVEFESEQNLDTLAIGLTLHENKGHTNCSSEGWISYWEPISDSEIGMGAWVDKNHLLGCQKIENTKNDMNNIWLFVKLKENKCTYYSGFGWKKSGQFISEEDWIDYIKSETHKLTRIH